MVLLWAYHSREISLVNEEINQQNLSPSRKDSAFPTKTPTGAPRVLSYQRRKTLMMITLMSRRKEGNGYKINHNIWQIRKAIKIPGLCLMVCISNKGSLLVHRNPVYLLRMHAAGTVDDNDADDDNDDEYALLLVTIPKGY
ncbi:hypothetical protein AVEN_53498-1 [Araneus ventricosus]|uniref:Uncharacterized protein n=1 Tax=Araneus ventricosus TaxID=182803 RepID=A0A4Y2AAI4_ARAVE|nr:hypothetical protein AVEN_53498-1 [Araneus ventricosus]